MEAISTEKLPIRSSEDVVLVRTAVRKKAVEHKFSIVDQTKLVTAASEIARNTLDYGLGGDVNIDVVHNGIKHGLRLVFKDQGPGIPDLNRALQDGYTSGNGMGLGLGGAKRLVDTFEITSAPGEGTKVALTKWTR